MHSKKLNILLIDDQELIRDGIKSLIKQNKYHQVVAEAHNGVEAYEWIKKNNTLINLVITEINLPGLSGMELAKKIRKNYPQIQVMALTMLAERRFIKSMFESGATAYMIKSNGQEQLFKALDHLAKGDSFWCNQAAKVVLDYISGKEKKRKSGEPLFLDITKRESEVLSLVLNDMTNHQIAGELNISPRTVEVHKRKLLEKTGTKSLAGLAMAAVKSGLFDADD